MSHDHLSERGRRCAAAYSLLIAVLALSGCQPQGAGSIKAGDPSRWLADPVAPSDSGSRKGSASTREPSQTNWKSPKHIAREREKSK
jgi:hypothetical protein